MQYTVVHSTDPYLLARLATDLQMHLNRMKPAFKDPFLPYREWLSIYKDMEFGFYNHDCVGDPIRHELTSSNYLSVLTKILS